jgi:hypothetical protein
MTDKVSMAHFNTAKCRSCGTYIVSLKTSKGNNMPVNADSIKECGTESTEMPLFDAKQGHISHFATCPAAAIYRKRDKR